MTNCFRDEPPKIMKPLATRRTLSSTLCLLILSSCCGPVSDVWPQTQIPRVVFFTPATADYAKPLIEAFRLGLSDVGLVEGHDIVVDYRHGERQRVGNYAEVARGLIALKPRIILAASTPYIDALRQETKTIPIVMLAAADPVGSRLVASLARPGGNVTGMSMRSPEVSGKRLELIKTLRPKARRVVIFSNPTNKSHAVTLKDSGAAARSLNLKLENIALTTLSDLDSGFAAFLAMKADAFTTIRDELILRNRKRFIEFAVRAKVRAVYDGREVPLDGGLMSFTPNHLDLYRRSAIFLDKILKGANPAMLPVERTMRTEFIVNLTAAKQIGLTIPPEMLTLADQVIE